jgi:hypothetical protein
MGPITVTRFAVFQRPAMINALNFKAYIDPKVSKAAYEDILKKTFEEEPPALQSRWETLFNPPYHVFVTKHKVISEEYLAKDREGKVCILCAKRFHVDAVEKWHLESDHKIFVQKLSLHEREYGNYFSPVFRVSAGRKMGTGNNLYNVHGLSCPVSIDDD